MSAHTDIQELLGAYALDALDQIERRRVERHVATCEDCAREVAMLRDTSSALAWLSPPEETGDLVDRMSASLPRRPRLVRARAVIAVAAAMLIVVGAVGSIAVRQRADERARTVAIANATRHIDLIAEKGFEGTGTLHVGPQEAVLVLEGIPDPGNGRAFQLWSIADDKPSSMVVVDGEDMIIEHFDWDGTGETFAVTIEPEGGSPVPTSDPVLIGS